ncbi:MAG TPA: Hsp20/alpha crystallin family protein [Planctomycetota bacterium]|nr:Hsp20/alpha crystallin family protein [Planctomycetota bacterium]
MGFGSMVPWRKKNHLPAKQDDRPMDPFTSLQREMNRLFEEFHRGFDLAPFGEDLASGWMPRVNVSESDKEICVTAELPGMDEKDIDVQLSGDTLTIKGEKKEEKEEKDRNWHRVERSYGSFHREIVLPAEVEAEKTEAKFSKGVLTVTIPKSKQAQKEQKKIEIKKA